MNRVRYCIPLCKRIVVPDNVEAFLDEYAALRAKYGFALDWNDHDSVAIVLAEHSLDYDALEDANIDVAYTDAQDPPEHKYLHLPKPSEQTTAFMRYVQYKSDWYGNENMGEVLDFRQWCAHRHSRAYWLLQPHINAGVKPPGA